MSWSIGFDDKHKRDIGYGVPSICDHPECNKEIDRGLSYVCGGDPYGGDFGCGLFFCEEHLTTNDDCIQLCFCCEAGKEPPKPSPDTKEWINHKLAHHSWEKWRDENKEWVELNRDNNVYSKS